MPVIILSIWTYQNLNIPIRIFWIALSYKHVIVLKFPILKATFLTASTITHVSIVYTFGVGDPVLSGEGV